MSENPKHAFGDGVICKTCGERKSAVFAPNQQEAAAGRGVCEECLRKPESKPVKKKVAPVVKSSGEGAA